MTVPERDLDVRTVADPAAREAAFAIRFEVFVDEQHVPPDLELDALDPVAQHVLATLDGAPVATGRLVVEPPGFEGLDPALGPVAHLGRIAVRAPHRGTGVGALVVEALESRAVAADLAVAYLSAQVAALIFYERLGYTAYGDVFDDAGIPHRHMTRVL